MGCRRSPFLNMGTTLAVVQSIGIFTFTFMRLWPGSIRREWPGSGAVRALDKKIKYCSLF